MYIYIYAHIGLTLWEVSSIKCLFVWQTDKHRQTRGFSVLFHFFQSIFEYCQILLQTALVYRGSLRDKLTKAQELLISLAHKVIKQAVLRYKKCVFHLTAQAYVNCFIFVNSFSCAPNEIANLSITKWVCSLSEHIFFVFMGDGFMVQS